MTEKEEKSVSLEDEGSIIDKLTKYIASQQFWVFMFATFGDGVKIMQIIEHKYYKPGTDANSDFALIIGPLLSYGIAKKTRMHRKELGDILFFPLNQGSNLKQAEQTFRNAPAETDRDVFPILFERDSPQVKQEMYDTLYTISDYWVKQATGT